VTGRRAKAPAAPLTLLAAGATWAPPWTLLQPTLDRLEEAGITVTRVDVDEDEAAAEKYRIISVPTILVLRGTEERRRFIGAVGYDELYAAVARRR